MFSNLLNYFLKFCFESLKVKGVQKKEHKKAYILVVSDYTFLKFYCLQ